MEGLEKNTVKHITFLVPIVKIMKLNDRASGDIIEKKITCKLKLVDSARIMPDISNIENYA